MRSKADFIREQGFTTAHCDDALYSALMFQPRAIGGVLALSVIFQNAWVFLALAAVLWWSTVVPSHNPFNWLFNLVMTSRGRNAILLETPPPRRFAQGMAGTVALTIGLALVAGAPRVAWAFEGLFAAAAMSPIVRRVCIPAYLYQLVWPHTSPVQCPPPSRRLESVRQE